MQSLQRELRSHVRWHRTRNRSVELENGWRIEVHPDPDRMNASIVWIESPSGYTLTVDADRPLAERVALAKQVAAVLGGFAIKE